MKKIPKIFMNIRRTNYSFVKLSFITILLLSLFTSVLVANTQKIETTNLKYRFSENSRNEVFEWEWVVNPTLLTQSFFDYMPGSYCSNPIRKQNEEQGNGIYCMFHAQETSSAQRREYYSYVADDGEISTSLITSSNVREGYGGFDIDPASGNPLYTWHADMAGSSVLDVNFCLDQFDLMGQPGLLSTPYTLIENTDNEFIWPYIFIGPSPNEGMRRVYVYANNASENSSGNPCENVLFGYADFSDTSELVNYAPDNWTFYTIEIFDQWREENIRPFKAMTVSENGNIAFVGHTADLAEDAPAYGPEDKIFILENRSYGEQGEWILNRFDPTLPVENPENYFEGESGPYTDMRFSPYVSGHHNATYDDEGNLHFPMFYALFTEENTWYPMMSTMKNIVYHPNYDNPDEPGELDINDAYPANNNPDSDVYLPWDPDGEGLVYEDGVLVTQPSWPVHWYVSDDVFHEQQFKVVSEENWLAIIFADGTKSKLYNEFGDQDYAQWESVPEMAILISEDYGQTWKEPVMINSIDNPEFEDVIPSYVYVSDRMVMAGNDKIEGLDIMFFDDNDYGSSCAPTPNGPATGGDIMYARIKDMTSATDEDFNDHPGSNVLSQNYPNPFSYNNSFTEIKFNLPINAETELSIYNLKGQKIKSLVNSNLEKGQHSFNWYGKNKNGEKMSSGVYFYKLRYGSNVEVKKMLLLK